MESKINPEQLGNESSMLYLSLRPIWAVVLPKEAPLRRLLVLFLLRVLFYVWSGNGPSDCGEPPDSPGKLLNSFLPLYPKEP